MPALERRMQIENGNRLPILGGGFCIGAIFDIECDGKTNRLEKQSGDSRVQGMLFSCSSAMTARWSDWPSHWAT